MKLAPILISALTIAVFSTTPVTADPGRGHGKGRHTHHHKHDEHKGGHRTHARYVADCPPGLAKKSPACIPPGKVGKRYGTRIGDTLRVRDYMLIRDLDRYGLEQRRGWNYYRDDGRIYRVDSGTRKILAVLNLIDAFAN